MNANAKLEIVHADTFVSSEIIHQTLQNWQVMKKINSILNWKIKMLSLALLILFTQTSCYRYFKIRTTDPSSPHFAKINSLNKNFIIHSKEKQYLLIDLNVDSLYLRGKVIDTTLLIVYYYDRKTRYYSGENSILKEAHIYLNPKCENLIPGEVRIPLAEIIEIHIIDKNKGKTNLSYLKGAMRVLGGIAATFLTLVYILN